MRPYGASVSHYTTNHQSFMVLRFFCILELHIPCIESALYSIIYQGMLSVPSLPAFDPRSIAPHQSQRLTHTYLRRHRVMEHARSLRPLPWPNQIFFVSLYFMPYTRSSSVSNGVSWINGALVTVANHDEVYWFQYCVAAKGAIDERFCPRGWGLLLIWGSSRPTFLWRVTFLLLSCLSLFAGGKIQTLYPTCWSTFLFWWFREEFTRCSFGRQTQQRDAYGCTKGNGMLVHSVLASTGLSSLIA